MAASAAHRRDAGARTARVAARIWSRACKTVHPGAVGDGEDSSLVSDGCATKAPSDAKGAGRVNGDGEIAVTPSAVVAPSQGV